MIGQQRGKLLSLPSASPRWPTPQPAIPSLQMSCIALHPTFLPAFTGLCMRAMTLVPFLSILFLVPNAHRNSQKK